MRMIPNKGVVGGIFESVMESLDESQVVVRKDADVRSRLNKVG